MKTEKTPICKPRKEAAEETAPSFFFSFLLLALGDVVYVILYPFVMFFNKLRASAPKIILMILSTFHYMNDHNFILFLYFFNIIIIAVMKNLAGKFLSAHFIDFFRTET